MGAIGNFGSLIRFTVSDRRVLTFQNMQKSVKGRWGTQTPIYGKPLRYFQGADLQSVTMTVQLDASYGVRPEQTIRRLENAVETGQSEYLVIGGKRLSRHRFSLDEVSTAYDVVIRNGKIYQATVQLTFTENP